MKVPKPEQLGANPKEFDAWLQKRLGRFYKEGSGIKPGWKENRFEPMYFDLSPAIDEPTESDGDKLSELWTPFHKSTIVFLGKSGVGKTGTITNFARENYCIYLNCTIGQVEEEDSAISSMIERATKEFQQEAKRTFPNLQEKANSLRAAAEFYVQVHILARAITLLKAKDAGFTPERFFLWQRNQEYQNTIVQLANEIAQREEPTSVKELLNMINDVKHNLIVAIDEAPNLDLHLVNRLFSIGPLKEMDEGEVPVDNKRSFLSAVYSALRMLRLVLAGTKLSLKNAEHIESGKFYGKEMVFYRITQFGSVTKKTLKDFLGFYINIENCDVTPLAPLCGRPRWLARVFQMIEDDTNHLQDGDEKKKSKQDVLLKAFKKTYDEAKRDVCRVVKKLVKDPPTHSLICQLLVPAKFLGSNKLFLPLGTADFINEGLWFVDVHKKGYALLLARESTMFLKFRSL